MTPTQPIPNFSLLFKTQELKSKITQASFAFPLVVNPCMYISVPDPTRQNGNGPTFLVEDQKFSGGGSKVFWWRIKSFLAEDKKFSGGG